jgi:acyl carrier protein
MKYVETLTRHEKTEFVTTAVLALMDNHAPISTADLDDDWSSLDIDPLDMVELVMEIEDHLNISISQDDVDECDTPQQLIELVDSIYGC